MKWEMAMQIASLPQDRWTSKIEWKPGLDIKIKANRQVGTARKGWEDEINEVLRPEESEESNGNDLRNNSTWKVQAKKTKNMENIRKITKKNCSEMVVDEQTKH